MRGPSHHRSAPAVVCAGLAVLLLGLAGCGAGSPAGSEPAAAAASAGAPASPPPAPVELAVDNIVLITIDTLRADALGFMGNREVATPTLDRLAAAGRVYRDAHAHNVVTLPSHANILTGLLPYEHGVRDNSGFTLPGGIPTAATLLSEAGFATAAVVGAFPLTARFGLDRGFDLYDDEVPKGSRPTEIVPAERRGSEVVRRGRRWWRDHAGQRRFLWLHLFDPHAPYEPPQPHAARYPSSPYLGEVAAVDEFLAPLLRPFLAGEEAPTLIVLTSDHGEALGDHGELTHGLFAYESTLHVPLVLWAPGLPPAALADPARHVDLLPTMLDAAGVAAPPGLAGHSLLAPAPAAAGAVYFESMTPTLDRGWAPLRGVIRERHKFISLPLPELYDLAADPEETRNLYAEERERVRELAALLPAESVWPPARGEVDEAERASLRSLGYVGGSASRESFTEADDPKRLVHLDRKMHRVGDLYQRGRLHEAARLAREVIDERPDMSVAHYYLAQTLLEQGQLDEAIATMSRARQQGVASPPLLRQLGLSLAEAGRAGEALELLEPLATGDDPDVLRALGTVLSEAGRQGEARAALRRATEVEPSDASLHERLALVALRERNWGEARDAARRALDLNPALAQAWNYLGTALYNLGSKAEALTALRNAVDYEPQNFDALYNAGVVALEIGESEQAREALRRFVAEAPPARYGEDLARAREWLRRLGG